MIYEGYNVSSFFFSKHSTQNMEANKTKNISWRLPGEWGGVLWEVTARLADLTLLVLATGEAGGMESEGDLLLRPPGEERGVGPRDMETPEHAGRAQCEFGEIFIEMQRIYKSLTIWSYCGLLTSPPSHYIKTCQLSGGDLIITSTLTLSSSWQVDVVWRCLEARGLDDAGAAVLPRGWWLDLDCQAVRPPSPLLYLSLGPTPPADWLMWESVVLWQTSLCLQP